MVCVGCLGFSEQRWQGGGPTLNPVLEGHLNQGAVAIMGLANIPSQQLVVPSAFPQLPKSFPQSTADEELWGYLLLLIFADDSG